MKTQKRKTAPVFSSKQLRDFITHVKSQADQLERGGVDREELSKHLGALEKALDANKPVHEVVPLLDELEVTLGNVENRMVSSGVLNMLNEIFDTGVPPV